MKNASIQSLLATNAAMISVYHDVIGAFLDSARMSTKAGEKAFAIEDYKQADKNRIKLAKLVRAQNDLKAAMAHNNAVTRIKAKGVRMFGAREASEMMAAPIITNVEIEAALDEALAIKFPPKADTRPADHPSFKAA